MSIELLTKELMTTATTIHVMGVVLLLLMYVVYQNYNAVTELEKEHDALMRGSEGYTARLPQRTSHTGSNDTTYGSVSSGHEGFLGAYGPPVFYDIGDANAQRNYQTKQAGRASNLQDITKKYASGRPMYAAKTDADGSVYHISLPDLATEGMTDEALLSRAQGFRSY
jgi:hypothetical protein